MRSRCGRRTKTIHVSCAIQRSKATTRSQAHRAQHKINITSTKSQAITNDRDP